MGDKIVGHAVGDPIQNLSPQVINDLTSQYGCQAVKQVSSGGLTLGFRGKHMPLPNSFKTSAAAYIYTDTKGRGFNKRLKLVATFMQLCSINVSQS